MPLPLCKHLKVFNMKCTAIGCKCEATKTVSRLWGKIDSVGFCENHAPQWLKSAKIGDFSPQSNMLGETKSWYKRIA